MVGKQTGSLLGYELHQQHPIMENVKYQEKREKDERMKHVVGGERETKKADSREREEAILSSFSHCS